MVIGVDFFTRPREADWPEIDETLEAAFGGREEVDLVHALRADGDMLWETIAPAGGRRVGGYYALSRMRAPQNWACLAPVAVWPAFQGGVLAERNPNMMVGAADEEIYRSPWRIGSRMMEALAAVMGVHHPDRPETIVVLGDPGFYGRFGFSLDRAQRLTSPYPLDHTLILRPGDDVPEETLLYPKAFG